MKRHVMFVLMVAVMAAGSQVAAEAEGGTSEMSKTIGEIERIDPAFDGLMPKDAQIEVLSAGHEWTEGQRGKIPASLGYPAKPYPEVERRHGSQRLHGTQRLHGFGLFHRQRTRHKRVDPRCRGTTGDVLSWRSDGEEGRT